MITTLFSKFGAYIVAGLSIVMALVSSICAAKKVGAANQKATDAIAQQAQAVEAARSSAEAQSAAAATATSIEAVTAAQDDPAVTAALKQFTRD